MEDDRVRKNVRFSSPERTEEERVGNAPSPSPPSAPRIPLKLPPCPIRQSLIYKLQLEKLRTTLREDEEKLRHTKDDDESRDRELQVLLLRADIEKLSLVLRSQLEREEATGIQSGVVDPALTRSSTLSGVNGISGRLPRLSIFMLKQAQALQFELRGLETQLEYMDKKTRKEEVTAKKKRVEDLRFFIAVFERHYKADREKEAAMRGEDLGAGRVSEGYSFPRSAT